MLFDLYLLKDLPCIPYAYLNQFRIDGDVVLYRSSLGETDVPIWYG